MYFRILNGQVWACSFSNRSGTSRWYLQHAAHCRGQPFRELCRPPEHNIWLKRLPEGRENVSRVVGPRDGKSLNTLFKSPEREKCIPLRPSNNFFNNLTPSSLGSLIWAHNLYPQFSSNGTQTKNQLSVLTNFLLKICRLKSVFVSFISSSKAL